jgi:hypothetical protein
MERISRHILSCYYVICTHVATCFSCTHDGDNCQNIHPSDINDINSEMIRPPPCIHGQVISFLKKKEFKTQNIEPEEYIREVIRIFEVRKK